MKFSNVTSAKPPLAIFIHRIILCSFLFIFKISHGDILPTDYDFASGVRLVMNCITAWKSFNEISYCFNRECTYINS